MHSESKRQTEIIPWAIIIEIKVIMTEKKKVHNTSLNNYDKTRKKLKTLKTFPVNTFE